MSRKELDVNEIQAIENYDRDETVKMLNMFFYIASKSEKLLNYQSLLIEQVIRQLKGNIRPDTVMIEDILISLDHNLATKTIDIDKEPVSLTRKPGVDKLSIYENSPFLLAKILSNSDFRILTNSYNTYAYSYYIKKDRIEKLFSVCDQFEFLDKDLFSIENIINAADKLGYYSFETWFEVLLCMLSYREIDNEKMEGFLNKIITAKSLPKESNNAAKLEKFVDFYIKMKNILDMEIYGKTLLNLVMTHISKIKGVGLKNGLDRCTYVGYRSKPDNKKIKTLLDDINKYDLEKTYSTFVLKVNKYLAETVI